MYNEIYLNDLEKNIDLNDLIIFKNKSILITGAAGLICSYIVDALMYANELHNLNIKVYALGRNLGNMRSRFSRYNNNPNFNIVVQDVCQNIELDGIDYIIHGASNANPKLYSTDPTGTMLGNFLGMYNVLELARKNNSKVIYISSSEVYGDTKETEQVNENFSGYINSMNYRSCYPNSKRAAETLCASYQFQYNLEVFVIRLCHIYGPTMTKNDNRAASAFIRNALNNEDIIMKSEGKATRCYCYVGDVFRAIPIIFSKGTSGEAYNLSAEENIVSVKTLADIIACNASRKVIIDIPENSNNGYSKVEIMTMDASKLKSLGWQSKYSVNDGINTTMNIMRNNNEN